MKKQALIELIKANINKESSPKIGGFAGVFTLGDQFLLASTDGVGAKLDVARWHDDYSTIGHDLVAMCVNDIVAHGGKPLIFLDYVGCRTIYPPTLEIIIKRIDEACQEAECLLIGGEVAELEFTYSHLSFDLAGFAVGIVDKTQFLPKEVSNGDIILGIPSNGVHSNGWTKIVKRIENYSFLQSLLKPTRIYSRLCLNVLKQTDKILALAHITGGGFTENIPRVLPSDLTFKLFEWNMPDEFKEIEERGKFTRAEMFETFNCGFGMIAIVSRSHVEEVSTAFYDQGEYVEVIGKVIEKI